MLGKVLKMNRPTARLQLNVQWKEGDVAGQQAKLSDYFTVGGGRECDARKMVSYGVKIPSSGPKTSYKTKTAPFTKNTHRKAAELGCRRKRITRSDQGRQKARPRALRDALKPQRPGVCAQWAAAGTPAQHARHKRS